MLFRAARLTPLKAHNLPTANTAVQKGNGLQCCRTKERLSVRCSSTEHSGVWFGQKRCAAFQWILSLCVHGIKRRRATRLVTVPKACKQEPLQAWKKLSNNESYIWSWSRRESKIQVAFSWRLPSQRKRFTDTVLSVVWQTTSPSSTWLCSQQAGPYTLLLLVLHGYRTTTSTSHVDLQRVQRICTNPNMPAHSDYVTREDRYLYCTLCTWCTWCTARTCHQACHAYAARSYYWWQLAWHVRPHVDLRTRVYIRTWLVHTMM